MTVADRTRVLFAVAGVLCLAVTIGAQETSPAEEEKKTQKTEFRYSFEYESFADDFDIWREHSVELSHKFRYSSLIGRINTAKRFGDWGQQYEVDAYPKLGKGVYAYVNAGYSDARFFPEWRYGAEIYKNLPASFEASLGFRQLNFQNSNVTLYTGSISKYHGNYFTTLRPFVSEKEDGLSVSGSLQVRRYYATADDYLSFVVSYGESPEPDLTVDEINRLESWAVRVTGHTVIRRSLVLTGRAGYRDQQFPNDLHRRSYFVGAGFGRRF